jgi:hypothetical protein
MPTTDVGTRVVLFHEGIPEELLEIAGDRVRIPIASALADELRNTGQGFYEAPDRSIWAHIILEH